MDLADKLGALSLKNAPIPEKGAGLKTKKLKTKEFEFQGILNILLEYRQKSLQNWLMI